jgi:hypothetical protein
MKQRRARHRASDCWCCCLRPERRTARHCSPRQRGEARRVTLQTQQRPHQTERACRSEWSRIVSLPSRIDSDYGSRAARSMDSAAVPQIQLPGGLPRNAPSYLPDVEANHQSGAYKALNDEAKRHDAEYSKIWDLFALKNEFTVHLARFSQGGIRVLRYEGLACRWCRCGRVRGSLYTRVVRSCDRRGVGFVVRMRDSCRVVLTGSETPFPTA